MKLAHEIITLRTKHPFVIARGGSSEYRVVRVTRHGRRRREGWGEAAPSKFYGETADTVVAVLPAARRGARGRGRLVARGDRARARAQAMRFNGSARAAMSAALHDLVGKRLGVPLYRTVGARPGGVAAVELHDRHRARRGDAARSACAEAAQYPVLKIKLGTQLGRAHHARRARAGAEQDAARRRERRVDAEARRCAMMPLLQEFGVEFVEQPLPPHDIEGLRFVRERSSLPIIADESCLVSTDIPKLVGAVDGINIKLAKCGGLREALRMIATARAHGMLVMAGCMIESSLGITAAAHFAPLLDCADFDGAALVANDPYVGATIDGGVIRFPDGAGLGVVGR